MLELTQVLPNTIDGLETTVVGYFPQLEIIEIASSYRNCYSTAKYRIRTRFELDDDDLNKWIRKFVMQGQGYYISQRPTQKTGAWIRPDYYETHKSYVPFYEYIVEATCDSGD